MPVPPDRVVITSGTSEGIELALTALAEAGDEVLVPVPTYPLYTAVLAKIGVTLGIVDEFEARGLRIFGATRQAAILEGSKIFAKRLMKKYKVPTGFFQTFYRAEDAKRYIHDIGAPIVVKADGLAAGKGAIVCHTVADAVDTVKKIMEDRVFGDAGSRIVVEEFLTGEEASFLAFADGDTVLPMASTQDHKAAFDDDKGPNTGGMGAYSPAPVVTDAVHRKVMDRIMVPTVKTMAAEGRPCRGVLYACLMIKYLYPQHSKNSRTADHNPSASSVMLRLAQHPSLSAPSLQRGRRYQECYVSFSFYQMQEHMSKSISNINGNHKLSIRKIRGKTCQIINRREAGTGGLCHLCKKS